MRFYAVPKYPVSDEVCELMGDSLVDKFVFVIIE